MQLSKDCMPFELLDTNWFKINFRALGIKRKDAAS